MEYDDLTKYVVSTKRSDPIHDWMESVLRISTGSLGHQIAALILRDVRPFYPYFSIYVHHYCMHDHSQDVYIFVELVNTFSLK